MNTRRFLLAALLSVFALSIVGAASAKDKDKEPPTRVVKGIVTDENDDPLSGVVQLKNTKTLDVRSYHLDPQGRFYFSGLDPNVDYEIKAIVEGKQEKTRRVSSFDDRMELFYQFTLKNK